MLSGLQSSLLPVGASLQVNSASQWLLIAKESESQNQGCATGLRQALQCSSANSSQICLAPGDLFPGSE